MKTAELIKRLEKHSEYCKECEKDSEYKNMKAPFFMSAQEAKSFIALLINRNNYDTFWFDMFNEGYPDEVQEIIDSELYNKWRNQL